MGPLLKNNSFLASVNHRDSSFSRWHSLRGTRSLLLKGGMARRFAQGDKSQTGEQCSEHGESASETGDGWRLSILVCLSFDINRLRNLCLDIKTVVLNPCVSFKHDVSLDMDCNPCVSFKHDVSLDMDCAPIRIPHSASKLLSNMLVDEMCPIQHF